MLTVHLIASVLTMTRPPSTFDFLVHHAFPDRFKVNSAEILLFQVRLWHF